MMVDTPTTSCRVCGSKTRHFGAATVLGRHEAQYVECVACEYVQVVDPHWLDEAYALPINESDVGLIGRNVVSAEAAANVLGTIARSSGPYLDYGSGYGIFARLMRDRGYDFRAEDEYCANLFASGHEPLAGEHYDVITAWEVFEHLIEPGAVMKQLAERGNAILLSTTLLPISKPRPGEWWYYGLEHGQHVGIFSRASLRQLAQANALHFSTNGASIHLLSREPLPSWQLTLATRGPQSRWIRLALRRRETRNSLTGADFEAVTAYAIK